ncbi:MAG: hypothetical protein K6T74_11745, partial [Geminicoccaceae bacterium]|nr:hypothetical protein [Geminicoccaceae bacterium]
MRSLRILIENGLVLAGPELEPRPGAAVAVENGEIVAVGAPPPGWTPEERLDAAEKVVMPGLINAHTHA